MKKTKGVESTRSMEENVVTELGHLSRKTENDREISTVIRPEEESNGGDLPIAWLVLFYLLSK